MGKGYVKHRYTAAGPHLDSWSCQRENPEAAPDGEIEQQRPVLDPAYLQCPLGTSGSRIGESS